MYSETHMRLQQLSDKHYGIDGMPVYRFVQREREKLGISKSRFPELHGLDRGGHYRFEAGQNRSLALAIETLEALGFTVTISVEKPDM